MLAVCGFWMVFWIDCLLKVSVFSDRILLLVRIFKIIDLKWKFDLKLKFEFRLVVHEIQIF